MQVLIIDKSLQIVERLSNLLLETGIPLTIHKAISYNEAIDMGKVTQPGVVLIDRHLPNGQSMRLLELFKEKRSVVVMMTLRMDADMITQCKLAGADFVLDKYYEFETLPGIIRQLAANN